MRCQLFLPLILIFMAGACLQAQAMIILHKESAPMRWDRRWCLFGCRYISVTAPISSATSTSEVTVDSAAPSTTYAEPSITFEPTVSGATPTAIATSATSAPIAEVSPSESASSSSTASASAAVVPITQSSSGSSKMSSSLSYVAALSVLATAILYI